MKILHLLKSNSYSGAENIAITICANIQQYICAYASPRGPIQEKLKEQDIEYYPMKTFGVMELKRVVREFDPDIIHAHDFSASVLAAIVGKQKMTIVSHLHNNVPWIKKWNIRSLAYRTALKRIDSVILVSDSIKREAVFSDRIAEKCTVLGNPLDKSIIRKNAEKFECNKYDVLFVGRLTAAKNPIRFINIIDKLRKKITDLEVCMVGNGDLFDTCKDRIIQLKLEKNVIMKGFCDNPYPFMKKAKLMLVTSDWEGFGLVAREALTLATPVLLMDVGGMHELSLNYPEIKCDTEEEFVWKAEKILNGDTQWKRLYENIFNEQEPKDNLQVYLETMEQIYQKSRSKG